MLLNYKKIEFLRCMFNIGLSIAKKIIMKVIDYNDGSGTSHACHIAPIAPCEEFCGWCARELTVFSQIFIEQSDGNRARYFVCADCTRKHVHESPCADFLHATPRDRCCCFDCDEPEMENPPPGCETLCEGHWGLVKMAQCDDSASVKSL